MQQESQFITNNAVLAFALFIGGIQPLKIHNEYDDALLDKLKVPGLKTARDLKKLGELKYFYERTDALQKLIDVFNEQAAAIDADQPMVMPNLLPEDAVRVACYTLKNRAKFLNLAFLPSVMMYHQSRGKLTGKITEEVYNTNGEKVPVEAIATHPGFSLVSMNLSDAKRKELKL